MGFPAPFIDRGLRDVYFETSASGERIECWPCGDHVHRGEYAIYDWGHCNCPHDDYPATFLCGPAADDDGEENPDEWQIMCVGCGNVYDWDAQVWRVSEVDNHYALRYSIPKPKYLPAPKDRE